MSEMLLTLFAVTSWENVEKGEGIAIAITGMLIVFLALVLISTFVASLPFVLNKLEPYLPHIEHHSPQTVAESLPTDEEKIVAAIGFVLHHEMQNVLKK
jgi:oxaloacetate decarboxylase gamma subunit